MSAEPSREQRKVVTILFCDLVGSTALGESTDPEALRARMRRYFEDLRVILERHGGTVEKFVGDAVMAVFGIPVSHEDDALRAVRAASEMQAAIAVHGLEARIGVNTGEVVVGGESETLVTGDAVNVAARLEQAAGPGETFIGSETRSLVRDGVQVEVVEPLALKGKAEPVAAFRLLGVRAETDALARHPEALLVGRKRERNRLWRDFEDVLDGRSCRLVTLLGPAGIGKSRLVADFVERVGASADILRGRCLSYGEGITYWPLVEILIAIGVEPDSVIGTSPPETQLAFRRLLEARAATQPQVVVVDDLQWAEPVFIDLVEHIADLSRDAPIFLLCVARTELLDVRPDWGGGKLNATSILLEPLGEDECEALIGNLLGGTQLEGDLLERITAASAGNPLYVEEMLAMVREHGGVGEIVVPPTIHALLQARIDSLDGDVRIVMERGSVEGEVFHRGAVAELSPALVRGDVESHLTTLVRKELIRSTSSTFPLDEGYRFRHLLIRDAAYESLPKATRAELHEQFADWLSKHELVEGDEIVGYHLEQAHQYRSELDGSDPALDGLARWASDHLGAAGHGALDRGDYNAGRSLLRRASALLPEHDESRLALAPDLAVALFESGGDGWTMLSDAAGAAEPRTRARAIITMATWALVGGLDRPFEERQAWRDEARSVFEQTGDEWGLALYWWSMAMETWFGLRAQETADACERALEHLERSGTSGTRLENFLRNRLIAAFVYTPLPVDDSIERIRTLGAGHGLLGQAWERGIVGRLSAMKGDFARGRELVRGARQAYLDAGLIQTAGGIAMGEAHIEWLAGDDAAAESVLREGIATLETIGERAFYPTAALQLATMLYAQRRFDEVREWCDKARATTGDDDVTNFLDLDLLEGLLLAREGLFEDAEAAAGRAIQRLDGIEMNEIEAYAHAHLAELFALTGRRDAARKHGSKALEIADRKGDVALGSRLREWLVDAEVDVL